MIEIAVCDDLETYTDQVERILLHQKRILGEEIEIIKFTYGEDLCEHLKSHKMDQIYLDIEMPKKNGIEVAEFLREELGNLQTKLIFMTGTTQYDRKLFDFQPFGFLEKPLDEQKLISLCEKACRMKQENERRFSYTENGELHSCKYEDIVFFQKDGHNIDINYMNEKKIEYDTFRGTIKELEQKLESSEFIRVSNSVIVNMNYIKYLTRDDVALNNGQVFGISRERKNQVKCSYMKFNFS